MTRRELANACDCTTETDKPPPAEDGSAPASRTHAVTVTHRATGTKVIERGTKPREAYKRAVDKIARKLAKK